MDNKLFEKLLEKEIKKWYKWGYKNGYFKGRLKGINEMKESFIKNENKKWKKMVLESLKDKKKEGM